MNAENIAGTKPTMQQQLGGIIDYVNLRHIAEDYLNKSPSWLYKKLKGQGFNAGSSGAFTAEECELLRYALLDLSEKIKTTALAISS